MTLHVLNGDEPDKISYFSNKSCAKYDVILHSIDLNETDTLNKIIKTINDDDKILITSESQLEIINEKYTDILDKFICIKLKNNQVNYLNNRETLLQLPTLTQNYQIKQTDNNGKFEDSIEQLLSSGKVIAKDILANGKSHFGINIGDFESDILKPNTTYLIQTLFDDIHHNFYRIPTIIRDGKIVECLPLTGKNIYNYCRTRWGSFKLDTSKIELFKNAINEIIDTFGIIEGIIEPEFAIDFNNNIQLISINTRWGYTCSITNLFIYEDEPCAFLDSIITKDGLFKFPENYSSETYYYGESYYRIRNDKNVILLDKDK